MRYHIFDPTGNITALVESPLAPEKRRAAADAIMARHPEVEQLGFVTLADSGVSLRMAGGEFCGNAGMSAAALWLLARNEREGEEKSVSLRVSGAERPLCAALVRESESAFRASLPMPPAIGVERIDYRGAALTLVRMQGICHIIVERGCARFSLLRERAEAERAVRQLCLTLGAPCLGLLFLDGEAPQLSLTPLVFVPGSDTLFWENACASGSAAVATALAERAGGKLSLSLVQPGGTLRVESDPFSGETILFGKTRLIGTYTYQE